MFLHQKELQFEAKPDKPNPLIAKYLQELIGGQYGEMSVAMQYLVSLPRLELPWRRKVQRYVDGHCDRRNCTR